jgi:hypothetical protein
VSTQLRLVEAPATSTKPAAKKAANAGKPAKSSVDAARRANRRPVNWGDWRLDARTRRCGARPQGAGRRRDGGGLLPGQLTRWLTDTGPSFSPGNDGSYPFPYG